MINWLLEHRFILVVICIASVMLLFHAVDLALARLGVPFQFKLPHRILALLTLLVVTLIYFTFFGITAIFVKLTGKRLLARPGRDDPSYWMEREKTDATLEYMKRQG